MLAAEVVCICVLGSFRFKWCGSKYCPAGGPMPSGAFGVEALLASQFSSASGLYQVAST